jgi:hypothetical protein
MSPRLLTRHAACLGIGLLLALFGWAPDTTASPPGATEVYSPAVLAALDLPSAPSSEPDALAITRLVPGDGAVIPWTFETGEVMWRDRFAANVFRVRIRVEGQDGAPLLEIITQDRRLMFTAGRWQRIRQAVGEGGAFEVELTAVTAAPDGIVLRGPVTRRSRVRFSAAGEHPTGRVLFGSRLRPAYSMPGPVPSERRQSTPMAMDMSGQTRTLIQDLPRPAGEVQYRRTHKDDPRRDEPWYKLSPSYLSRESMSRWEPAKDLSPIPRVEGQPAWVLLETTCLYRGDSCMGCHTSSDDGRYLAVVTADDTLMPDGWTAAGFMTAVLRAEDHEIVKTIPGAMLVSFHPTRPDLLIYFRIRGQRGMMGRMSVTHGDIHAVDLARDLEWALPGASEPGRCEFFPSWSPDGERVLFSRARPGRPCVATHETYEIVSVPWNEGRGGEATPLIGATAEAGANLQPRVSPDGRWVVFYRASEGFFSRADADLWVTPAQGGEARRLSVSTDAMESWHAFSPDGRWLVFLSNRDRVDRPRAYLTRFSEDGHTTPAIPLPSAGGPEAHVDTLDWVR